MDIDVESFFVASLLERLPRRRNGFVQPHNMHTAATFSIWKDVNMFYSVLNFAKVSVKIMESLKIVQLCVAIRVGANAEKTDIKTLHNVSVI